MKAISELARLFRELRVGKYYILTYLASQIFIMEVLAVFAIDAFYVFSYYHRNNVIERCRYIT